MQPIFNEYNSFLKDNNLDFQVEEGMYWLDRQIIKAYDKNTGELRKLARIYVDEDLGLTLKRYKYKEFEIESWQETITRQEDRINQLEQESLNLIKEKLEKYKDRTPYVLTSDGKDSVVTEHLVQKIVPDVESVFNNTSLDIAATYKHIKSKDNTIIVNPKEGFHQWLRKNMIPTRISRACCRIFKEGETVSYFNENEKIIFFMGMRNQESSHRSGYVDEWRNDIWGYRKWDGVLPIRKWTEEDIWLYTLKNNLYINYKYKQGYGRVG